MSIAKSKLVQATLLVLATSFLMAMAPLAAEQFSATEAILPFVIEHQTVANPALEAWNAAPSNPCGAGFCLKPMLDVYYHIPARTKAVAYVFHGGSGSAKQWITGEEEAALLDDLVRNQYAVVLLESARRPIDSNWFFPDPERFDPANLPQTFTPNDDAWNATVNADEYVVRNVHTLLGYDTNTPVTLVGFSSGAKFASAMAYNLQLDPPALGHYGYAHPRTNTAGGLNVRAAALYNNVGVPYYFGNYQPGPGQPVPAQMLPYNTPTIFNYSLNDAGNPTADVAANADFLATLPVPVEKNLSEPSRLQPDRFARVLGVSYAESRDLYAALAASEYVDTNGFVLPGAETALAGLGLPAGKRTGVKEQLVVVRAEHHVSSEFHHRTVAFFNLHLEMQ